CYALTRAGMRGMLPTDSYYMNITASTLVNSFGAYFNMLFGTNFRWQIWCIGFFLLLLMFALLRNRLALFFQSYVFFAFLSVIFLINHRYAFYWYLPFLGICGLAATLAKIVAIQFESRNPLWLVQSGESVIFILLCWVTFLVHKDASRQQRSLARDRTNEYRAFITGL